MPGVILTKIFTENSSDLQITHDNLSALSVNRTTNFESSAPCFIALCNCNKLGWTISTIKLNRPTGTVYTSQPN